MNPATGKEGRVAKVEQFQRKHRTGLVTLLFTDIVGSTGLKSKLGDQPAAELLLRHHALVRDTLQRFPEGGEIGTTYTFRSRASLGIETRIILLIPSL